MSVEKRPLDAPVDCDGGRGRSQLERLRALVSVLGPLVRPEVPLDRASNGGAPPLLSTSRLISTLTALRPLLKKARQEGGEVNVWQMAGLKRVELRNAAVLAALWSPAEMGDRAANFLGEFLRRLTPNAGLPSGEELASHYVVRTEHCATGAATERVDITIEGRHFVLGLEIKIGAGEGPEQLTRYQKSVEEWAHSKGKRGAVVLLAPFRTIIPGIIQADWRDIVSAARATLPAKQSAFTHADRLIYDFARHAAAFQGARM
jgi:hypothetical protein